ncbi:MAG: cyclophilin-like fold protein [Desulfobacteraceae bacterium]|jgi:hypothetical protein
MRIIITINHIVLNAEIDQSPTAKAVASALPIRGAANVWGDEIYFDIPVDIPLADDAREEVEVGTLAYWPTGNAFCIFFGPTPVSTGAEPRAYSPVNIFGHVIGDVGVLKSVVQGAPVIVSSGDER